MPRDSIQWVVALVSGESGTKGVIGIPYRPNNGRSLRGSS